MVISEVHIDSTQQAIRIIQMGGLSCAGCVGPLGDNPGDYSGNGSLVCSRPALEHSLSNFLQIVGAVPQFIEKFVGKSLEDTLSLPVIEN